MSDSAAPDVAHQAPLSLGFSTQEHWSGSPCPPPGDLPDLGIEPVCCASCIGRQVLYPVRSPRIPTDKGKDSKHHSKTAVPGTAIPLWMWVISCLGWFLQRDYFQELSAGFSMIIRIAATPRVKELREFGQIPNTNTSILVLHTAARGRRGTWAQYRLTPVFNSPLNSQASALRCADLQGSGRGYLWEGLGYRCHVHLPGPS